MTNISCHPPSSNFNPAIIKRTVQEKWVGNAFLGYKEFRKRISGKQFDHLIGRVVEIEKLIQHRHGSIVPETDDAHMYADVIASLIFVQFGEDRVLSDIRAWCGKWMPWHDDNFIDEIVFERLKVNYTPLTADALGRALHVSYAERCELDLRTIGAFDVNKRERAKIQKAKRKQADRKRKEKQRRKAGQVPRPEYLANSASQTKPWEFFGYSRRTWERKGKPRPPNLCKITSVAC